MSAMPVILGLTFLALFTKDLNTSKSAPEKKPSKRPEIIISYKD